MPGDCVDILGRSIDHSLGVARHVGVVVVRPDLDVQTRSFECGTKVVRDERSSLLSRNVQSWGCCGIVQRLILEGYGVHDCTFGSKGLDVLDEILGIRVSVRFIQAVLCDVSRSNSNMSCR